MKRPAQMRERVMMRVHRMIDALRIDVSCYHTEERDVMVALNEPQKSELVIALTNDTMALLGHETDPPDPRFDKTRRLYNRKVGKEHANGQG